MSDSLWMQLRFVTCDFVKLFTWCDCDLYRYKLESHMAITQNGYGTHSCVSSYTQMHHSCSIWTVSLTSTQPIFYRSRIHKKSHLVNEPLRIWNTEARNTTRLWRENKMGIILSIPLFSSKFDVVYRLGWMGSLFLRVCSHEGFKCKCGIIIAMMSWLYLAGSQKLAIQHYTLEV